MLDLCYKNSYKFSFYSSQNKIQFYVSEWFSLQLYAPSGVWRQKQNKRLNQPNIMVKSRDYIFIHNNSLINLRQEIEQCLEIPLYSLLWFWLFLAAF